MYQILQPRVGSEPSFTLHAPVSSPPDRRQSTPPQRALPVLSHPRNLTGVTNEPVLNMGWFAGFWGPVHAECTRALQCCECATEGARTKAEDLFGASKITAANNMAIGAHFRSAAGPDRPIQTIPDGKSQAGSDEILHSETGVQFQIGQKPKGCPPSWSVAAVHLFHHRESAPLGAFFAGCISGRVSKWFLVAQPADGGSAPSRLRVRRLCYVWWLAVAPPWAESPIRSAGRRVNILLHVGAASGGCSAHESGRPYRLSICQKLN